MISMPSTGLFFLSPGHFSHSGFALRRGGENIFSTLPRTSPSNFSISTIDCSCPLRSSIVLQRPAGRALGGGGGRSWQIADRIGRSLNNLRADSRIQRSTTPVAGTVRAC